jgi:hypothetical protein
MIEMLEGVPGSGKSYYAVAERFLSWVRANRKIYIYVEGIFLDRLGAFEGRTVEDLSKQIIVWQTADEVRAGLLSVESGSAVIIDEAQTIFRSREKVEPELLRMLETHRHKGLDLVMMCQQHGQMTLGVLRLVEVTTKFRRLDRFGLKGRYQAQVRGNPEETEVIRMFTGKYSPKVYAYYSSYSQAAVRESVRGGSILKSPTIVIGAVGLLVAVAWFGSGQWLTPSSDVLARQSQPKALSLDRLPPPPPLPAPAGPPESVSVVHPVRIQGGLLTEVNGTPQWLYVSESGRIMTDEDIAMVSGGIVNARMDRGVRVLYGSGVIWGGTASQSGEAVASGGSVLPVPAFTTKGTEEKGLVEEVQPVPSGSPGADVFTTPQGILATPPPMN